MSSNQTSQPASRKLVLNVGGVPEHFNLPWHLAIESGAFSQAGVELKYQNMPGGTGAMINRLRSHELDIAIVLAEGGVASILRGNKCRLVKTYVQSPLIWGIHVAADSGIESVDQIRDRRYAISRFGSGSHLMAIVDASERGWPTTNLKFEKIDNLTGAREALSSGTADTFFWERFTTAPLVESGEFRRVGERRTLWPAFAVCVRDEILDQQAHDVKTVLEIVNQNCRRLMADKDACKIISARYKLKLAEVEEWFAQTEWSTDFKEPIEAIKNIKSYLVKLDLVTQQQADTQSVWHHLI